MLLSRATGSVSSGNLSALNVLSAKRAKLQATILLPLEMRKVVLGNTVIVPSRLNQLIIVDVTQYILINSVQLNSTPILTDSLFVVNRVFLFADDRVKVNDGKWHSVVFNITGNQSYVTVDGSSTFNSSRPSNGGITSLLLDTPVVVGGSVFKGCLDSVRIGGLLLPFVDYYNNTLNVSHVTPLKPHFNVTTTGLQSGCHSDDVCGPKPCERGLCSDIWNQFTCTCPEGWAGLICTLRANMTCAHSPCVNGSCYNATDVDMATNQSQVSDVGFDMFRCNCTPGFEGKRCENATDECVPNPCQNGANCTDLYLNYTCTCVSGYTGRNCEINIDDCASSNCTNNSTCNDGIDSYNCSCLEGFNGTFCELDIDECDVMKPHGPCNATGTVNCSNTVGGFDCNCKQGYFGEFCEYDPTQSCEKKSSVSVS